MLCRSLLAPTLVIEGVELFGAYEEAQTALVDRLIEHRRQTIHDQSVAIFRTAVITGLITLIAAAVTMRRSTMLRRSLEPPLEDLLDHLGAIQAGDFSRRPPVDGPEEITRIAAGVRAAAASLARAAGDAADHSAEMQIYNRQLAQVLRLAREVAGSLNMRYVLRAVSEAASTIADGRRVIVWLRAADERSIEPVADTTGPDLEPGELEPVALGEGVVGRAARYGRVEGHSGDVIDTADGDDELAVPMVVGAEVIGVILVCGEGASTLAERTVDVLEALAVQAASAVASARIHEQTETMALTDALTHLPNRRRLEDDLATETAMSTRYDRPLAFAMLDVDHFKAYNDTLGHQAADVALQELAGVLRRSVRAGDVVYRYGGEEIAVVMRETTAEAGHQLAERLRGAVEHHFTGPDQPRPVTISAGVAAIPEHGQTAAELVAAADAALYEAKRSGRNRVRTANGGAPLPGHVSRH
jgi:diguanylate cyclase (GGDEF)-like protein